MRIDHSWIKVKKLAWLMACAVMSWTLPAIGQTVEEDAVIVDELGDPLPAHAILRFGSTRFLQPSPVVELALSPDNQSVITAGQRDVMAWDLETGKLRWKKSTDEGSFQLPSAAYGIRAIAFGPGNDYFYTASPPQGVLKWSTLTGEAETVSIVHSLPLLSSNRPLNGLPGSSRSVDITADGKKIALAGAHGVVVCDATGKVLFEIANSPTGEIQPADLNQDRLLFGGHYSLAIFSPDDRYLAVVTSDTPAQIRLVDSTSGAPLRKIDLTQRLVRMDFSPDSTKLVTTERDSAIRQYKLDTGEQTWEHVIELKNIAESYTAGIATSPDGKLIATCAPVGSKNWIYLLNSCDGKVVAQLKGHAWKPADVAFSSDSQILYSTGWDGAIRRWDMKTFRQLDPPKGVRGSPVVAATPTGQLIAYADDLQTVHVVDSRTGKELSQIPGAELHFSQLAFSEDGRQLAGGGASDEEVCVVVWDWAAGTETHRWQWPKGKDPHARVDSLTFSADTGRIAAAVFRQSKAYLWGVDTGNQIAELIHPQVYGLSISPHSKQLATVGWDEKMRLWDVSTGAALQEVDLTATLKDRNDVRMVGVRYSPRGDCLATAHMDGTVRIWNRADLSLRNRLVINGSFVYGAFAFSPDGMWLATGVSSGEITIWDPRTGKAMWDFGRHQSYVYTIDFVDNGRSLVSGGDDRVAYAWKLYPTKGLGEPDFSQLWRDLGAGEDQEAYRVMWQLMQIGEPTVRFIGGKLRVVKSVIDFEGIGKGLHVHEADRRRRLTLQLVEKDPRVEFETRVQLALSLLSKLNTTSSRELLKELAESHSLKKIRDAAAVELQNSDTVLR